MAVMQSMGIMQVVLQTATSWWLEQQPKQFLGPALIMVIRSKDSYLPGRLILLFFYRATQLNWAFDIGIADDDDNSEQTCQPSHIPQHTCQAVRLKIQEIRFLWAVKNYNSKHIPASARVWLYWKSGNSVEKCFENKAYLPSVPDFAGQYRDFKLCPAWPLWSRYCPGIWK